MSLQKRAGPDVFLRLELLLSSALADVGSVALHIAIGPTASHSGQPNAIVHLSRTLFQSEKRQFISSQCLACFLLNRLQWKRLIADTGVGGLSARGAAVEEDDLPR